MATAAHDTRRAGATHRRPTRRTRPNSVLVGPILTLYLLAAGCGRFGFAGDHQDANTTANDASGAQADAVPFASCTDQLQNGDEIRVDCGGSCAACTSSQLFWTDYGQSVVASRNLQGGAQDNIVSSGHGTLYMMAASDSYLFWADYGLDVLARAKRDGTDRQNIVSGLDDPRGVVFHEPTGKIYFSEEDAGSISRANLDGSNVEIIASDINRPYGLAIDFGAQKLYWVGRGDSLIQRANLDGSSVETITPTGIDDPVGIHVAPSSGQMYWTQRGLGSAGIYRAALDGSNAIQLVSQSGTTTQLALDFATEKIYWIRNSSIRRADFDGNNVEDVVSTLTNGRGLALY